MMRTLRYLLSIVLLPVLTPAQSLDELVTDYEVVVAELDVDLEQQRRSITKGYTRSLQRARQSYQQQGQLKGLLAVDKALEYVKSGRNELIPGPQRFTDLQRKYFSALDSAAAAAAPKREYLRKQMLAKLLNMQKIFVRIGKLDAAVNVREEIARLKSKAPPPVRTASQEVEVFPAADTPILLKNNEVEGKADRLAVRFGTDDATRMSFVRFNLSKLKVPIQRVILRLYCDVDKRDFSVHPQHHMYLVENTIWQESATHGKSYPKISDTLLHSWTPPPAGHHVHLDVTESVKSALAKPHKTFNFCITASETEVYIGYGSREKEEVAHRPVLIVNPVEQGVALSAELKKGLAHHLGFDTSDGDVTTDLSGGGNHAAMNGGQWMAQGKVGGACWFDSKNFPDLVVTDEYNPADVGTAALWFRPAVNIDATTPRMVVLDAVDRNSIIGFNWVSQSTEAEPADGTVDSVITPISGSYSVCKGTHNAWQQGTWYHVVATWDGTTQQLFVNGVMDGSCEQVFKNAFNGVRLGRAFIGAVDELMFWDRVLSDAEIRQLFEEVGGAP